VLHCTHQPGKATPVGAPSPLARGDLEPHRLVIVTIFQRTGNRPMKNLDPQTRTELEAAAFRRLLSHLRNRTDVQNIDMMNLTGFCRNCLSNWLKDAADERDLGIGKEDAREHVYGMPYEEWKNQHQAPASAEQQAAFAASKPAH
jgi:hypothetical protein